ncbi:hypothetical protein PspLS_10865 [Pyricularia sp. CBS 133598]|nr:hypothetical protein PspLS_10865 [Pyricularia sp. CBS 133598]
MPQTPGSKRQRKPAPGISREDSDDELGDEDLPWEWIYDADGLQKRQQEDAADADDGTTPRKRKRTQQSCSGPRIVGARMGNFECRIGDTVLLKAEGGSNEAWVGIICEFVEEDGDDGEKAAHFLWFSTEREIRNKEKKRTDFLPNELYVSPSWDVNPLAAINGKATVMSQTAFLKKYPNGKVPRNSKDFGKVFICRRGCNTRTASYTGEFVWEDIYRGTEADVLSLGERIKTETKATRARRKTKAPSPDVYEFRDDNDGDEDRTLAKLQRTPKKPRTGLASAVTPSKVGRTPSKPATPSSHRRIVVKKHLEFTPLATRTLSPAHHQNSPFQLARAQLHVASVPTSLPCREAEFSEVYSHLEAAITDGAGSCIYISGTPGTGKTATVREVVASLDHAVRNDELDDFIFVEINGMKVSDPHQAYSLLWEALKGQRVSPAQALDLLEREFSNPSPRRVPCVVLMDELDQLVTKNQGVMYNFFNWPGLRHSRLIVLAVANTMDLPERTLSNKISSRLGLTRITFPGYTHEQLMKIIQSRLEGVPGNIVEPDAIQFASRKVAAVSGDARRALDICRRAVELAEAEARGMDDETPDTPSKRKQKQQSAADDDAAAKKKRRGAGRVTIDTIRRAIAEATSSPLQQYLRALPFSSRLLLAALLVRVTRTGLAESTYGDVLEEMQRAVKFASGSRQVELLDRRRVDAAGRYVADPAAAGSEEGGGWVSSSAKKKKDQVMHRLAGLSLAAVELTGAGIVNLEAHRAERPSKIRLAVGDEEVRLAFRDDPEIKALGLVL